MIFPLLKKKKREKEPSFSDPYVMHYVLKAKNTLNVAEVVAFVFLIPLSQHARRSRSWFGLSTSSPQQPQPRLAIKTFAMIPN